jgi:uracil phosphoribosyltransferase
MLPENVHVSDHPLIRHKLSYLRDKRTEPKKFRELIREISILLAYEATADLGLKPKDVETPMGTAHCAELTDTIGLVPVLRAGLGMVEGIWEMMPGSEVWHIGLFRDERTLRPVQYYNKLPVAPTVQVCLILDPMLATGGSAGVERLHADHPDVPIHLAALDERLNEVGYIVPGLGDAGDRQFGTG